MSPQIDGKTQNYYNCLSPTLMNGQGPPHSYRYAASTAVYINVNIDGGRLNFRAVAATQGQIERS
jgi:hypothetical protein